VNAGTISAVPSPASNQLVGGKARRRLTLPGWGGGSVVVRGRESRAQNAPETVGLVLSMLPPDCTDNPRLDCADRATYLHDLFLASDTTVAMLTDVPNSGPSNAPIPFAEALSTQEITDGLVRGGASRLFVENVIALNVEPLGATLDEMSSAVQSGHPAAF
jgi:hypothetical protein